MGKSQRSKGRKGQREFRRLLEDRDWQVAELNGGTSVEDFWATDEHGKTWSVEVKNTASINVRAYRQQAMRQAGKMPWLLGCKIDGTSSWLILRKAMKPIVWNEKQMEKTND